MPDAATTSTGAKPVYDYLEDVGPEGWRNLSRRERDAINAVVRHMRAMRDVIKMPGTILLNLGEGGRLINWNIKGDFS